MLPHLVWGIQRLTQGFTHTRNAFYKPCSPPGLLLEFHSNKFSYLAELSALNWSFTLPLLSLWLFIITIVCGSTCGCHRTSRTQFCPFVLRIFKNFNYVSMCMCMCGTCALSVNLNSGARGVGFPRAGLTGGRGLSDVCARNWSSQTGECVLNFRAISSTQNFFRSMFHLCVCVCFHVSTHHRCVGAFRV